MPAILIPNFRGELIEDLAWNVAVVGLLPVEPDHQLMTLFLRERQDCFFQFSQTHRGETLPSESSLFKSRPRCWSQQKKPAPCGTGFG
jgi:hypothetical protein